MKISKFVGICFILFFLTLGISTASDLNDSNALLQSDYGSFNELQNLIDESLENSTVNLTKDYFSDNNDFPDGITINKALTINGNNHVIDADFNSRIFILNIQEYHDFFKSWMNWTVGYTFIFLLFYFLFFNNKDFVFCFN